MFSLILWLTYVVYILGFIAIGSSQLNIPLQEHAYIVLITFAVLTWLTITIPINSNELAVGEHVNQGYWNKALTLCLASGSAVICSGIMMPNILQV